MRPRVALFGRAVQLIFAVGKNLDFNLASIEFSLAENAKALIVERAPVPELVFGTQDQESVFRLEISIHCIRKKTECVDENAQSGDWMIEWSGKILRTPQIKRIYTMTQLEERRNIAARNRQNRSLGKLP
jgi:hypothetical protein